MTNIRDRIAEVIAEHSVCECGDYAEDSDEHFSHIADMLIETLGLTQQWTAKTDGSSYDPVQTLETAQAQLGIAQRNSAYYLETKGRIPDFARNPRIETRYVTEWTKE